MKLGKERPVSVRLARREGFDELPEDLLRSYLLHVFERALQPDAQEWDDYIVNPMHVWNHIVRTDPELEWALRAAFAGADPYSELKYYTPMVERG